MNRSLGKALKITGAVLALVLSFLLLIPVLFPGKITRQVKKWANQSIEGEFNFSRVSLSFFRHFPQLTLTLHDYYLTGAKPFEKDTLASGQELGMGINLLSLFRKSIEIRKFYLDHSAFNVQVDSLGNANYLIYKSNKSASAASASDTSAATLNINGISITNSRILYHDRSIPMIVRMDGLEYEGKGGLANSQFDLVSSLQAASMDFSYDGTAYLQQKKLKADLITGVNTHSLTFKFAKNNLLINQLPVDFSGDLAILEDGYQINLDLVSGVTDFSNIFSAIPPEYNDWLKDTRFGGRSQITLDMKGTHRASTKESPTLHMHLWVKDGLVHHQQSPAPLEKFNIGADVLLPSLSTDSLVLQIDSLQFLMNRDPFRLALTTRGLENPSIRGSATGKLDIGMIMQALGIKQQKISGKLEMDIKTDGIYHRKQSLFPATQAKILVRDGLYKSSYYPNPVSNIQVDAQVQCPSGKMSDLKVQLQPVSFVFEKQPFSLKAQARNADNIAYDIFAKGTLDLDKIYRVFAIEGYKLTGLLQTDLEMHGTQNDLMAGRYEKLRNNGTLTLQRSALRTDVLPWPLEIPNGQFRIQNDKAWMRNTQLKYHGNGFTLEGYASNFLGYFLKDRTLNGALKVETPGVVVEDFTAGIKTDTKAPGGVSKSPGVVVIPKNLNLRLQASAGNISFKDTKLKGFRGELGIRNGKMELQNNSFQLAGARIGLEGSYTPTGPKSAAFSGSFKADSFDVKRFYNEVPLFREMATSAKGVEGLISMNYQLTGKLNADMMPVYPSLKGKGFVRLENVKFKKHRIMGAISKATGKDSLPKAALKAVVLNSSIANNIITIERTKMKMLGFRPRLEGQSSFDGRLNLKMRLGLPPLGIIGIPLSVTGTSEKPVVKIRRGREEDELKPESEEDN